MNNLSHRYRMKIIALLSLLGLLVVPGAHADAHRISLRHDARTRFVTEAPKPAPTVQTPTQPVVQTTVTTTSTTDFAKTVESEIFRMLNEERTKNGLGALKSDTTLQNVARAHSDDMLKNNYFSHTDLTGCNSACRVTNAGYTWSAVGENIYFMKGYNLSATETAKMMVDGWMNSPGHRANILNTSYTFHGVGVAQVGSTVYATDDFALPR
ncbi:CAP domain-containing protein [Candidatus Parcubacteria bacterium]|nr:CAP domain-containing protein [Candidatus Parcubacteria bacterium]